MMPADKAWALLQEADVVCSEEEVAQSIRRLGTEITAALGDSYPLVLSVMGGAVYFVGQLLPHLRFPLDLDYIHATRYGDETSGGKLHWRVEPRENVKGRTVLVLDDILDAGHTLVAIRDSVLERGAASFHCAVLSFKETGVAKPIDAEFVGVRLPNRYVFGCGMDCSGVWRNLPAIYAVKGM
jgi:hypoxanthine phosphoribosyltransferase